MQNFAKTIIETVNNLHLSGVYAYWEYNNLFISFNYPENTNVINVELDYPPYKIGGIDFADTNQETTELELDANELPKLNQVMQASHKYM